MRTSENKIKLSHMLYIVVFISILIIVRWGWYNHFSLSNPPAVKQGVLDLRGVDIESLSTFPLDGEWEFYPEQWVNATNIDNATKGQMLQVPGNWNAIFKPEEQKRHMDTELIICEFCWINPYLSHLAFGSNLSILHLKWRLMEQFSHGLVCYLMRKKAMFLSPSHS